MAERWWIVACLLMFTGCSVVAPAGDRLVVDSITVEASGAGTHAALISGYLLDTCTQVDRTDQTRHDNTITLTLIPNQPDSLYCPKLFAPFDLSVALNTDGLPPGQYTVTAGGESATLSLP